MTAKERAKINAEEGNFEISHHKIICPYCGHEENAEIEMYFGDTSINPYEEGEMDVTCPECKYTFILDKELQWNYKTDTKKEYE